MVNRTQALVLGFFVVASLGLLVILVAAPGVYDQALRLPAGSEVADIAFLGGTLRVPVAILQITGPGLPSSGSALGVAEEGGTIAIQATTMPPCRRSPHDANHTPDELLCSSG
jgi:hypothetical protein